MRVDGVGEGEIRRRNKTERTIEREISKKWKGKEKRDWNKDKKRKRRTKNEREERKKERRETKK